MNREIKFRAWDESNKRMLYSDKEDVQFDLMGGEMRVSFWIEKGVPFHSETGIEVVGIPDPNEVENPIIMQFTGLKDKKGNEIYEGDIMKVRQRTIGRGKQTKYKDFNVPVEFYRGEFILPFENYGEYRFRDGEMEHFEVIGNIYETPELTTT